jgi:hypothetical protein
MRRTPSRIENDVTTGTVEEALTEILKVSDSTCKDFGTHGMKKGEGGGQNADLTRGDFRFPDLRYDIPLGTVRGYNQAGRLLVSRTKVASRCGCSWRLAVEDVPGWISGGGRMAAWAGILREARVRRTSLGSF